MPKYIRDTWEAKTPAGLKQGDYVLASKYRDGDPGDQFCVGFYDSAYDHFGSTRHLVIDGEGQQFRRNGFRRVARVGRDRGAWIVRNLDYIEEMRDRYSVWHWWRAPWRELRKLGKWL